MVSALKAIAKAAAAAGVVEAAKQVVKRIK
jgi:hypothetical protein